MARAEFLTFLKRRRTAAVLVVVAAVILGAFLITNRGEKGVPVATAVVEEKLLGDSVFSTGRVELADKQEIFCPEGRVVTSILVQPGSSVVKGQVLGYLERPREDSLLKEAEANLAVQKANLEKGMRPPSAVAAQKKAALKEAEVAYDNASKELERMRSLLDAGAVSQQEMESCVADFAAAETSFVRAREELNEAVNGVSGAELQGLKAQVVQAEAQLELAQSDLEKYILRSNINGTVLSVDVDEGDFVNSGSRLLLIGNMDSGQIRCDVGEGDSSVVVKGQRVEISAAAFPEKQFAGTVTEIGLEARIKEGGEAQQVVVPVTVKVEPGVERLLPGCTVDLRIITVPERKTTVVPFEAIFEDEEGSKVFIVEDGLARLRAIEIGMEGDFFIEVLEGLALGERVILSPGEIIRDGTAVTVQENGPGIERD